jgi:hypothetical protein
MRDSARRCQGALRSELTRGRPSLRHREARGARRWSSRGRYNLELPLN